MSAAVAMKLRTSHSPEEVTSTLGSWTIISTVTRLILVRHGHHAHGGRFWQHRCPGLTDTGRAQAQSVARALAAEGVDAVLASNAARAWQTAEATAETLGLRVVRTCDLCEMHPGEAEGLTPEEMAANWGPTFAVVPGAIAYEDWLATATQGLRRIVDEHDGSTIVGFTHTAVLNAAATAFGDLAVGDLAGFANGSISEWSSSGGAFEQVRLNDVSHL